MDILKIFKSLSVIDLTGKLETRKNKGKDLTYLSWASAIEILGNNDIDYDYKVIKNENGLPYVYDENTGYMIFTEVTISDKTKEMWLPVMDGANKAMKKEVYEYTTKYGTKTVEAASMFDINKTIMRCLVKNFAMFGLGIKIYVGEDLPDNDNATAKKPTKSETNTANQDLDLLQQLQTLKTKAELYKFRAEYQDKAINKKEFLDAVKEKLSNV